MPPDVNGHQLDLVLVAEVLQGIPDLCGKAGGAVLRIPAQNAGYRIHFRQQVLLCAAVVVILDGVNEPQLHRQQHQQHHAQIVQDPPLGDGLPCHVTFPRQRPQASFHL